MTRELRAEDHRRRRRSMIHYGAILMEIKSFHGVRRGAREACRFLIAHALAHPPNTLPQLARTSLVRCLVTQVDGIGRGSIGISVSQGDQRREAAFSATFDLGSVTRWEKSSPSRPPLVACSTSWLTRQSRSVPEMSPSWLWGSSREV